ncbi:hypothetical protein NC653_012383 [Populus alba x Populus x berolinensis]|uniref:Uncharacterized protein n=2 Tax=Populus alba x Populus x berolinensis TaxID=444605 RepID=A0AAD6R4Q8_9ROSI|nr:hypothetical protein NC653_012383 [Populus alba x Populus x berolinensis]
MKSKTKQILLNRLERKLNLNGIVFLIKNQLSIAACRCFHMFREMWLAKGTIVVDLHFERKKGTYSSFLQIKIQLCILSCPLSESGQAWETNLLSKKEKLCLHRHQTGQSFS